MSDNLEHNNLIARWLEGRLTEEEKASLEESGELDSLKVVMDDIDTWKLEKFDVEAGLNNLLEKKQKTTLPTKSKNNYWLRIAASVAILFSSYFVWYYSSSRDIIVTTAVAENQTITLPDGSIINLDALSTITYNKKNWENDRVINLSGQAFFDVSSGTTFTVTTNTGNITVLGTQFNVKTANQKLWVQCYEGKVQVAYKDQKAIITKGQEITLKKEKLIQSEHQKTIPDWTNGYSSYHKTPLSVIAEDLQKYYEIRIQLPKKYEELLYTGTLHHSDLTLALETLFVPMEINYTVSEDGRIVLD